MVPSDYPLLSARARFLEMEMAIRTLRSDYRGHYSFRVEDLHSGMSVAIGGDEAYPDTVQYRLALCLYAFARSADGGLDLNTEIEYLPEDRTATSGPLQFAAFGSRYSMQQLCQYAVLYNDGIARRMLSRTLGETAVKDWLRSICGPQGAAGLDGASPAGTVSLLKYLLTVVERQPLLGGTLLEWMIQADNDDLAAQLPDGLRVAHSPVTTSHTVTDAGVVFLPKAPYVVSIMADTTQAPDTQQAENHVARVSQLIYDHLVSVAGTFVGVHAKGERLVTALPVCLFRGEPVGPVAEIAGALGVTTETNAITQAITMRRSGAVVTVTPGDARLQTQSDTRTLPVEPFLLEGVAHAPLAQVFTALGAQVDWDPACNRMALSISASN